MTELVVERRRTGWDIALGVLLVIGGLSVLGHTVLATVVSVLLIGWLTLFTGLVAIVAALTRIGKPGFWSAALTGGLLTVLGLMFLRHTGAAVLTLTLLAGFVFLTGGIVRLIAASERTAFRVPLIISGVLSVILGLIVVFNLFTVSFTLLGVLLGIEILIDGFTLLFEGRLYVRAEPTRE